MVGPVRNRSARAALSIAAILLLTLPALSGAAQTMEAEEPQVDAVTVAPDPITVHTTPGGPEPIEVRLHEATLGAVAASHDATDAHGGTGSAHGDSERFPLEPRLASQSPYVDPTPTDLDDDPRHRARFVLDRNWGLSGSTFRAVANVVPQQGLTGITWAFDAQEVPSTASTIDLRIADAGLHFLTLTATWSDGSRDAVTSPIYVEDPAITQVAPVEQRSTHDPNGLGWLPPLAGGDATPLREHVLSVVEEARLVKADHEAPTVLLVSDFVLEDFEPALLNVDLGDPVGLLTGIAGTDPAAGFGSFTTTRPGGVPEKTPLGHDVTIVGQYLAESLIDLGANVVFVGGLDKTTGALDRAAVRNGLLYAQQGGVDAVVWGLPSATYLPAVVQNGMRPAFGFSETPLFATDLPPYGYADWRQGAARLPDYYVSIMEQLYETAFLLDSHAPETEVKDLADALWRERDSLPRDQQRLVSAFRNDQAFDEFLQDNVLRLADAGVPFVTPSEECAGMEDRFMTVLGVNHVPGAVTVASGRDGSPDGIACKGPDRRAASHGTGVDFVADPRPFQEGPQDTTNVVTPGDLIEEHYPEGREASYVPNSLGAATRVAAALAHLKEEVSSPERPWKAPDLVGMLAVQAESDSDVTPWEEGIGFLDIDGLYSVVPGVFPRTTEIVFLPYNPFEGKATGFLQLVLVGEETVAAAERATVDAWNAVGGTEVRFFTAPDGTPTTQTITLEDGTHMSVRVENASVERALGPDGQELAELAVATLTLEAYPTAMDGYELLGTASEEGPSIDCTAETNVGETLTDTLAAVGVDEEVKDQCVPPDGTQETLEGGVAAGEDALADAVGGLPDDPTEPLPDSVTVPDVSDAVEEPVHDLTEPYHAGPERRCTLLETNLGPVVEPTADAAGQDVDWNELCILPVDGDNVTPPPPPPPHEWLLPGLYTGRTWISTPSNGILQLPINIGVGTIFDTFRFLAPDKPVSDTAVCLALPLKLVGDLTGLRQTVMELDDLNVCIYWANTDDAGVARFYTPLPIPYDLISFFSPHFEERYKSADLVHTPDRPAGGGNSRAPPYYPQIHDSVTIVAPINVTGVTEFVSNAPEPERWLIADPDPEDPDHPIFVDADLPYPLAMVYQNRTYPVAISVHWQYRDNMETTHILPVPSLLAPEFLSTLEAIPNPLHDLLLQATGALTGELSGLDGGLLTTAPDRLPPILGTAQDAIKEGMPVSSSTIDALLGQPVTRALPVSLQPDPGTCSWGYGHDLAPELRTVVDDVFDPDAPISGILDALDANLGAEAIPDTLTMRVEPTIEHLLGLTTNIPLCTAIYPFNLPQPNEDTFFIHEFDLHLESTVLVVCLQVALVECFILAPNPLGGGVLVIDTQAALDGLGTDLLTTDPDRTLSNVESLVAGALGQATGLIPDVQDLTLPDKVGLATDGHVALRFEQYTKDRDHGYLSYIALPLDLSASGFLDPLVGVLEENGIALEDVLGNLTLDTPIGEIDALSDVAGLVRDSATDLLRTQPYVEIQRPVFLFDTWWWDDSFFDARVAPTRVLPRTTADSVDAPGPDNEWFIGEDFWWLTFPNINQDYFRRGVEFWDPVTLQPDTDRMRDADYPWNQPEFFEAVLEFWDDEEIDDITPNQFHIHSARTFHQSVQSAKHCSNDGPGGTQRCFQTGLDFDGGNGWLIHDDKEGNGVYDPDQGLKVVMLNDLGIVDGLMGTVSAAWQSALGIQLGLPLFGEPQPLSGTVQGLTGIDLSQLEWWKRDGAPTANRRVYSDMYQNSSYFLSVHTKTCEERAGLPHQAPFFTDHQPRWKSDCPWEPSDAAKAAYAAELVATGGNPRFREGWIPDDPDNPVPGQGHHEWRNKLPDTRDHNLLWGETEHGWHRVGGPDPSGDHVWEHVGTQCEPEPWQTSGSQAQRAQAIIDFYAARGVTLAPGDVTVGRENLPYKPYCGNFDGWNYRVVAPADFDGPRRNVWTAYAKTLHPTFHPGTYAIDFAAWNALCPDPCANHPLQLAWTDLVDTSPATHRVDTTYVDADGVEHTVQVNGAALAMAMFGMSDGRDIPLVVDGEPTTLHQFDIHMGDDLQERFFTVPVDSDPHRWFSPDGSGSEFGIFYRAPVWEELDADFYSDRPQQTWQAMLKQAIADHVDAVRTWIDQSPYFTDVTGERVPFQDLMRPRISHDPENPILESPDGGDTEWRGCVGVTFHGHCRAREVFLDAGDLSVFGRAGYWGREAKAKLSNIPQGSLYARWNAEHWVRDDAGTPYSTIDTTDHKDVGQCWFRSTDGHGEAADGTHLETRPFYTTSWHDPFRAGTYNHESNGRQDPVPPMFRGKWCELDGVWMPARGDREYVDMRLPLDFNGGDPGLTIRPPLTPYVFEGGTEADVIGVKFGVGNDAVTALLLAILNDVLGLADGVTGSAVGTATGGIGQGLVTLSSASGTVDSLPGVGMLGVGDVVDDAVDLVDDTLSQLLGGSPVVPVANVAIDPSVAVAEMVVVHDHVLPEDTQAVFLASTDLGQTWHLLPARGAPGFVGDSDGASLAFVDLSQFRGDTVLVGTRVLGDAWKSASWDLHRITVLPAGVGKVPSPPIAGFGASTTGFERSSTLTLAQIDALPAGSGLLLDAPLTIPAGEVVDVSGVQVVSGSCGDRACPLRVDGTLVAHDAVLAPAAGGAPGAPNVGAGFPIAVTGLLEATGVDIRGLLGGLHVLGGEVRLKDCRLVDTGHVGALVLLGSIHMTGCVVADQTLGVYALGSEVRVEDNLFYRNIRSAGVFDDSWGVVRDNRVFHTKQGGFQVKGPLGAGDLALFNNHIEQVGGGINTVASLEDRVLGLDPRQLSVPVDMRDRIQDNFFEWNNLEAIDANALSAPVIYNNEETHSNVGVRVGWLDAATVRYNTLYSDTYAWQDPEDRASPPDDGNVWAGLWQILSPGLNLEVDARDNHYGPGPVQTDQIWPSDVIVHDNRVTYLPAADQPVDRPLSAALTAPGYGGGLVPVLGQTVGGLFEQLQPEAALTWLTTDLHDEEGHLIDPGLLPELPLDLVQIDRFEERPVSVTVDVAPGVTSVQLEATYYGFLNPPDLTGVTNTLELSQALAAVPITDPTEVLNEHVTRTQTVTVDIPAGATHKSHAFTFDGLYESRVEWRIVSITEQGSATPRAVDAVETKNAVVHNSLVWPLLPEVVFLVTDLGFQTFDELLGQVLDFTIAGAFLENNPLDLADLPLQLLPDGTLPVDGTPSLVGLVRDQDPVRSYEFRYRLSTDPAELLKLDDGLNPSRASGLPDVAEGVTLSVQGRALDASNLASPFIGGSILVDRHKPDLDLTTACIAGPDRGIQYEAREWRDPAWEGKTGYRPSGMGNLKLKALQLPDGQSYTHTVTDPQGPDVQGEWILPPPALVNGAAYLVTGTAKDRAGHVAHDLLPKVVVDLTAPDIAVEGLLARLVADLQDPERFLNLVDVGDVGVLLSALVDDTPPGVPESCGLDWAAIQLRLDPPTDDPESGWIDLARADFPDGTTEGEVELSYNIPIADLLAWDGRNLQLRVVAQDSAGHRSDVTTPSLLVDLLPPLPTVLPDLPVCVGPNTTDTAVSFLWGATDQQPLVGAPSGLEKVRLLALRSDATMQVLDQSPDLDGPASWQSPTPYDWAPLVSAQEGQLFFLVDARDLAGNGDLLSQADLDALTPEELDGLLATAKKTAVDNRVPTIQPADGLSAILHERSLLGLLPNLDGYVGGLPLVIKADVRDPAFSCLLDRVEVTLTATDGSHTWTTSQAVVDADEQAVHVEVDLKQPAFAPFEGKEVDLTVRAVDKAGNEATSTTHVGLVDLDPPVLPPAIDLCIGRSGGSFTWGATDPSVLPASGLDELELLLSDAVVATLAANGELTLEGSHAPPTTAEALLQYVASVRDRSGNSATGAAADVTVDLKAPAITWLMDAAGLVSFVSGSDVTNKLLDLTALVADPVGYSCGLLSGVLEYSVDGTTWQALASTSVDGQLHHDLDVSAHEGLSLHVRVRAEDIVANADQKVLGPWLIDLTPPTITIPEPGLPDFTALSGFPVAWSAVDALPQGLPAGRTPSGLASEGARLLHGTDLVDEAVNGGTLLPVNVPDATQLTVKVKASDAAGNARTVDHTVTTDYTAPALVLSPSGTVVCVNQDSPDRVVSFGADDAGSGLAWTRLVALRDGVLDTLSDSGTLSGAASYRGSVTFDAYQRLGEGTHLVFTQAADTVGNALPVESLTDGAYTIHVDGTGPTIAATGELLFSELEAVPKPLADLAQGGDRHVGGNDVRVDVTVSDGACGLVHVRVLLETTDGLTSVVLLDQATSGTHLVDLVVDLHEARFDALEGRELRLVVEATDGAGNVQRAPSHAFILDTEAPDLTSPTKLKEFVGIAGLSIDWSATDAVSGVVADAGQFLLGGEPVVTVLEPGVLDPAGHNGKSLGARVTATDAADNVATLALERLDGDPSRTTTADLDVPVLSIDKDLHLQDDGTNQEAVVTWHPVQDLSGLQHVLVTRTATKDGVTTTTESVVTTEVRDGDPDVRGSRVSYSLVPVDNAGNVGGAVPSRTLLIDFEKPTLTVDVPDWFGRVVADATDLGLPVSAPLDLGPAGTGRTVVGDDARQDISLGVSATHASAVQVEAFVDGVETALVGGALLLQLSGDALPHDRPFQVRVEATSENDLTTTWTHTLFLAVADGVQRLEENDDDWSGGATLDVTASRRNSDLIEAGVFEPPVATAPPETSMAFQPGLSGSTSGDGGALRLDATSSPTTASTAVPASGDRQVASALVKVESRTGGGRMDLLRLDDADGEHVAVYITGTSNALYMSRPGGTDVNLGRTVQVGQWLHIALNVLESRVAVYLDNQAYGIHAMASAPGGVVAVQFGGSDAKVLMDELHIRAVGFDYSAVDDIYFFEGEVWTVTGGTGTATSQSSGQRTYLHIQPTANYVLTSPSFQAPVGSHVSLHFRVAGILGDPTLVAAIVDGDGDDIARAYAQDGKLWLTDVDGSGTTQATAMTTSLGNSWHRLDLRLLGDTVLASLDQREHLAVASLSQDTATQIRVHNGGTFSQTGDALDLDRVTVRTGSLPVDHAFTDALGTYGWSEADPTGAVDRVSGSGFQEVGRLEVSTDSAPGTLGFAHAPLVQGSRYGAEIAVNVGSNLSPPRGQAALAGVSGTAEDPVVHWALLVDQVTGTANRWGIYLWLPDGTRTLVSDQFSTTGWHLARVLVDEEAGDFRVTVDEGTPTHVLGKEVGDSFAIAVGDVFDDASEPVGGGLGIYDDVSVFPVTKVLP